MTSTTPTTWTSIDNARTRRASARLEAFLDEPGYEVSGCYRRGDGQIAVVYSDFGSQGLFAVKIEDIDLTDEIVASSGAYTEFCESSTDLADEALARTLLAAGETRTLKYSGSTRPVLADEPDGEEVFAPHVLLMPDVDVVVGAGLTVEAARRDAAIEVGTGTLDLGSCRVQPCTPRYAERVRVAGQPEVTRRDTEGRWAWPDEVEVPHDIHLNVDVVEADQVNG